MNKEYEKSFEDIAEIFKRSPKKIIGNQIYDEVERRCKHCKQMYVTSINREMMKTKSLGYCQRCAQEVLKVYQPQEKNKLKCEVCGDDFYALKGTKFCSPKCRKTGVSKILKEIKADRKKLTQEEKKAMEKKRFYNSLEKANKEIRITETRVYGQGRYEAVNFIGDLNIKEEGTK